ncbi:MAG: acyltransferase [Oscillospiraceae bacterium]|nr:acyltransferase [Oscillospiraceae bacterium]
MNKKELVVKYRSLVSLACAAHNFSNVLRTKKKGEGNKVTAPCALLKKVHIDIKGKNNTVTIGDFSQLNGASIVIHGNNNHITIGSWCTLVGTELCIEDSGNAITIGEHTRILGKTHLAAIEGTQIRIGGDCLFSSDVHIRTGDSHSVLDLNGMRINPSENIVIGDHVWVGTKVTCLKGAAVPSRSIIGACALVTGKFTEENCALAGVPAKVVKRGVDWDIRRLPIEDKKGQVE